MKRNFFFFLLTAALFCAVHLLFSSLSAQNQLSAAEQLLHLADSYADAGQTGLAMLNYERALLLVPGAIAAENKLSELRSTAGLLRKKTLPEQLSALLGADQWLLLSGSAFFLFSLTVLAAGLLGRQRFPQACRLSALLLAAALLPLPPAWLGYQHWQDGVVLRDAQLQLSPFAEAEQIAALKGGSLVRPLHKKHESYLFVRDEDGRSGWLEQSNMQQIAPSH
ncbi:hypothetical protein [Candidatus Electronema sp. JM]|uniref:hypothetical protein n=1 Tax=Candidatus Electronema sp. JM TaxID=3401571 RepID=UPI003AA7F9FA